MGAQSGNIEGREAEDRRAELPRSGTIGLKSQTLKMSGHNIAPLTNGAHSHTMTMSQTSMTITPIRFQVNDSPMCSTHNSQMVMSSPPKMKTKRPPTFLSLLIKMMDS